MLTRVMFNRLNKQIEEGLNVEFQQYIFDHFQNELRELYDDAVDEFIRERIGDVRPAVRKAISTSLIRGLSHTT